MTWQRPKKCDSGACVEVWQRPCESGHCLETFTTKHGNVLLRASEQPDTVVELTPDEMRAFVLAVKAGEYDQYA